ncbi:hypothetical protein HN748_02365 [Candidatus Peregrinibacteria bacterium]|nr:hypothetical protein [Candidatus Peregrinibacteria bacterium]
MAATKTGPGEDSPDEGVLEEGSTPQASVPEATADIAKILEDAVAALKEAPTTKEGVQVMIDEGKAPRAITKVLLSVRKRLCPNTSKGGMEPTVKIPEALAMLDEIREGEVGISLVEAYRAFNKAYLVWKKEREGETELYLKWRILKRDYCRKRGAFNCAKREFDEVYSAHDGKNNPDEPEIKTARDVMTLAKGVYRLAESALAPVREALMAERRAAKLERDRVWRARFPKPLCEGGLPPEDKEVVPAQTDDADEGEEVPSDDVTDDTMDGNSWFVDEE